MQIYHHNNYVITGYRHRLGTDVDWVQQRDLDYVWKMCSWKWRTMMMSQRWLEVMMNLMIFCSQRKRDEWGALDTEVEETPRMSTEPSVTAVGVSTHYSQTPLNTHTHTLSTVTLFRDIVLYRKKTINKRFHLSTKCSVRFWHT